MYLLAQIIMLFSIQNAAAGFWTGRLIMMALFITIYSRGVHAAFVFHRLKNEKEVDRPADSVSL